MKKIKMMLMIVTFLSISAIAKADPTDKIWLNFGSMNVYVPFGTVNAVGLWDGVSKRGMAGAETPLASWKNLQFVGGAVTTIEDSLAGTPFIGFNVAIPNPAENYVALASFKPGIFAGRNFRDNTWVLGLKASVGLF